MSQGASSMDAFIRSQTIRMHTWWKYSQGISEGGGVEGTCPGEGKEMEGGWHWLGRGILGLSLVVGDAGACR